VVSGPLRRTLEYRLKLVNNISSVKKEVAEATKEETKATEDNTKEQQNSAIQLIHNITVLSAMREGINGIVNELNILGIVSEKQYLAMRKMAAGVALFVDVARTMKGVIGLVELLTSANTKLAVVKTYNKILDNPAYIALAGAGLLGAVGVGGYLYGKSQSNNNNVTQNINISGQGNIQPRGAARASLEGLGGY